jgi:glycine oxidase
VAIVGGGVIGLAVGWRALAKGLSVTVLERGEPGQETSRVAAGMIAPITEAEPGEASLLALSRRSAELYPAFVQELIEVSGIDPGYRTAGTLFVARDADEAAVLERELGFRQQLGLPVERMLASEARRCEPALAPTLRLALDIPDDRAIDPRALTKALAVAFEREGGTLLRGAEVSALATDAAVTRVNALRLGDGTVLDAGQVVIAAGPWSTELPGLPERARMPVRPVKGQVVCLRDPTGPGLMERVLRMQPGYLVPRGDGRYVLGASVEERGYDRTITAGAVFELLRDAIELVPGVSEFVIEEMIAGIRPGTPDNGPILGPGGLTGLQWATGHYRHGILLTPVTADIVAAALAGEPLPPEAAPFAAQRFADGAQGMPLPADVAGKGGPPRGIAGAAPRTELAAG